MKASDIPTKIPVPWAQNATATYKREIPQTTADPTAASFSLGWPPDTGTPTEAGGTPPDIRDANGSNYQVTAWLRWAQAGVPPKFDSVFSNAIGGYPINSILADNTTPGKWWISLADDNTNDPNSGNSPVWMQFPTAASIAGARNGQCYFGYNAASGLCTLTPVDGSGIVINQVVRQIPVGGLSISSSGLAPNTFYYAYAYWTGSAVALALSPTGRTTGPDGTQVKQGDAAQALVGAVFTNSLGVFEDDSHTIGVISWFSRRPRFASNAPVPNQGWIGPIISTEVNPAARTKFIRWSYTGIVASFWNVFQTTVDGSRTSVFIGLDGVLGSSVIEGTQFEQLVPSGAGRNMAVSNGVPYNPYNPLAPDAENVQRFITIGASVFENTTTWIGNGGYGTAVQVTG